MDIPALVKVLIKRMCDRDKADRCHVTKEAMERLMGYDFPGNVRELLNILQQALALSPDGIITPEHIRLDDHRAHDHARRSTYTTVPVRRTPLARETPGTEADAPWSLADAEARHIAKLMQRHDHNRHAVAEALGISERTLYRKIKRYHLNSHAATVE
jgi:DNA-binding NtrC family response regulator